jgi:hypothetical protein
MTLSPRTLRSATTRRQRPSSDQARCDSTMQFLHSEYIDPARQRGDVASPGAGKRCGQGYTSKANKCRKNPSGLGPRNFANEINEQRNIRRSNDFDSWRKANKLRMPKSQDAFYRLSKQYAASEQATKYKAAAKSQTALQMQRNQRNAGLALLGGVGLGLAVEAGLGYNLNRRRQRFERAYRGPSAKR